MKDEIIVHLSKIDYEMLTNIWSEVASLKLELKQIGRDIDRIKTKTEQP